MPSSARFAYLGLLAVGLTLAGSLGVLGSRAFQRQSADADQSPPFVLRQLDGAAVSSSSLRGKVAVLVFASSRCATSNAYAERVANLARQLRADERVRVMVVETAKDGRLPSLDEVRVHARVVGLPCPVLLDSGATVARQLGVASTPTACVLDERGIVRYRGPIDDHIDPAKARNAFCLRTVRQMLTATTAGTPLALSPGL